MKEIIIDGEKIEAKSQVNEIFVKELGLPEYCGNNLDMIGECLDELKTPVEISFVNRDRMKLKFGRFATVLSQMLKLAAKHNSKITYYESK
ncbi:MAG: barstar family protein [Clostridia bacterium]|nr:barstar family protein [Clostridia bacterium]